MTLDPEFLTLMPDTVTVYPQSSLDKYGKRTWSASGTSYRCRIQSQTKLFRDPSGREVTIDGRVFLYGAPSDITTDHRLVLPDGSSPVLYVVNVANDETGAHHTVLEYGKG